MVMLYRISLDVYTNIHDQDTEYRNELKQLNDVYSVQYKNILSLLKDDSKSRSSIIEYVSQSAEFNREQKRRSDELVTEDNRVKHHKADSSKQATTSNYIERMKFVERFKESRAEEGNTMSWELCLLEGREKPKWRYKNTNSFRAAFAKYEKNQ